MPLKITIPAKDDFYDGSTNSFITMKEQTLNLEHSLISLSKWERKIKKPFLSAEEKSAEEWIFYIKCMTLNPVNELAYACFTQDMFKEIMDYIADPMTATTFGNIGNQRGKPEIITSEIIYYYMFSYGLPIELEKWHLNTLMALIRVFSIKNGNQPKMSSREAGLYQRQLNEARRAAHRKR